MPVTRESSRSTVTTTETFTTALMRKVRGFTIVASTDSICTAANANIPTSTPGRSTITLKVMEPSTENTGC